MRAPVGAVVGMYYDADIGDELAIGHALQTPTGRTYVVLELRVQARGKHAGRYHLRCLVSEEPPPAAPVHQLVWYPRG